MELKKYKLEDIADVEISGVDKKTKENEIPVQLCNFTDVYNNWAITKEISDSFMTATVNQKEFDGFSLKKGQVAFTKDSETRDDIGIPTYIADDLENVVLGYHTALITPDKSKLSGKYLNAFMNTKYIQKFFENNACGSGQRYTLSYESLKEIPIIAPDLEKQKKIGDIFSNIDRKITLNKRINIKLEQMAKRLYDYWFVQYDFPDKNGHPYKTTGGPMTYNPTLKREIPVGWEVKQICDIASFEKESVRPSDNPNIEYKHFSIPGYDECGSYVLETGESILSDKFKVSETDILVSKLNPWTSRVIWGESQEHQICSTEFIVMELHELKEKGFLYSLVKQPSFIDYCTRGSSGTSHSHRRVNPEYMMDYIFAYDKDAVQCFSAIVSRYALMMMKNLRENRRLTALRDKLLPLLMNGQVEVG